MLGRDLAGAGQIGDGPRDLDDPIVAPDGETEPVGGGGEEGLSVGAEGAEPSQEARGELGVGAQADRGQPLALTLTIAGGFPARLLREGDSRTLGVWAAFVTTPPGSPD